MAPVLLPDSFVEELTTALQDEFSRREVQAELQRFYTVALAIHPENTRRLRKMTPRQYERLLHPAFEDDEWILTKFFLTFIKRFILTFC